MANVTLIAVHTLVVVDGEGQHMIPPNTSFQIEGKEGLELVADGHARWPQVENPELAAALKEHGPAATVDTTGSAA